MASECFLGTIPLLPDSTTLTLPSARCTPEGGICYSSLSRGGGQVTAQLGCWPRQTSGQLAWLGVPECKNEVKRLVCLCLETLCNGFVPSTSDIVPEGGDLQGMVMLVILLLLGVMLAVVLSCVYRLVIKKHGKEDRTELEKGEKEDSYCQKAERSLPHGDHCPSSDQYPYHPPPPWVVQHINQPVPVPLIRMASAPARLKRNSAVSKVDGLEDLLLIGYLDRSNFTTKAVKKSVKRIDRSEVTVEGEDNYAFSISKTGPAVKSTGKVTTV